MHSKTITTAITMRFIQNAIIKRGRKGKKKMAGKEGKERKERKIVVRTKAKSRFPLTIIEVVLLYSLTTRHST